MLNTFPIFRLLLPPSLSDLQGDQRSQILKDSNQNLGKQRDVTRYDEYHHEMGHNTNDNNALSTSSRY